MTLSLFSISTALSGVDTRDDENGSSNGMIRSAANCDDALASACRHGSAIQMRRDRDAFVSRGAPMEESERRYTCLCSRTSAIVTAKVQ